MSSSGDTGSRDPPRRFGSSAPPGMPRTPSTPPPPLRPSTRPPAPRRHSSLKLPAINYDLVNAGRRVIEAALSVVPGESVLIIVDRSRRDLGVLLQEVTKMVGASATVLSLEEMGTRPIRRVPDRLRDELARVQASVLLTGFGEGEHGMRVELLDLVKSLGLRHGHMVGITALSMVPGFSVDSSRILDATRAVRTRIRPDSILRVRSTAGSDLEVRLDPRHKWVEHSGVVRPGRWENLPSGKIHTAPARVDGVFVADASIGEHFGAAAGLLSRTPVRVDIEDSVLRRVRCDDRTLQREIDAYVHREPNGDRIGTITLGTNVGLLSATGELICDLNLPGVHVSFGSTIPEQTGAAWSSRAQLPMTGASADVDLDGLPLLRAGRYLVT